MDSTPGPDLGSSTDQQPDDKPETGESTVDAAPTATTPAHGSSNAGVNETRANRVGEQGSGASPRNAG